MHSCVQDRNGTGFLKTQNILRVYIKTPPLTATQTACDSTERFHSPRYSAVSAVGSRIVLMIYFKADAQRRINTLSNKIHRNSPEGIRGGRRLD